MLAARAAWIETAAASATLATRGCAGRGLKLSRAGAGRAGRGAIRRGGRRAARVRRGGALAMVFLPGSKAGKPVPTGVETDERSVDALVVALARGGGARGG